MSDWKPQTSTCKGCGATIIWARNPVTGKKVPLISRRTTGYTLAPQDPGNILEEGEPATFAIPGEELVYVSHYMNCPAAKEFHQKP